LLSSRKAIPTSDNSRSFPVSNDLDTWCYFGSSPVAREPSALVLVIAARDDFNDILAIILKLLVFVGF